tara:strand:+ start:1959 stop:3200 length:1242 start_codon:yes stop_codon:yes gene_type:complete
MFFFYQIIVTFILILSPFVIIYRIKKNKEDKIRFIEKFSIPTLNKKKGKLIWIHGASVGEILSIIPVIKYYEKKKLIKQILITSSTLSSSKILNKFHFKKTVHQYYPIDHIFFVKKFLNYWKPSIAIFIESEIWPCMFSKIKKNKIPLILLNARLTKKTFKRWMNISFFAKEIFNKITIAYPQNLETKNFLKKIELKKIEFIGNLKFAENSDVSLSKFSSKLKNQLKNKKIWVASSTHKNEELFCAKAHLELKKKYKNLLTIIIPRHIHRVDEIKEELSSLNLNVTTHKSKNKNLIDIDIYIVDTFGETGKFHNIACSVFLGGSIINRGGQNPLEAARFGSKILHGANIDNFKDVYKLLKYLKISKQVKSPEQLASSIIFKKNKNLGLKIKDIGKKILNKTVKELDNLIKNEV